MPVPEERLRALEKTAAKRATEYHVVGWTGLPPLDVLGPFAHLHTLMDADVPTGELSREPVVYDAERVLRGQERLVEQGYGLVTTLIRDQDDSPVGYTTMCVMGGDNQEVLQDNTFVLRSRRGRGLGMLSKLSNLRLLSEHHPHVRHVHTWTAEDNDAMRAVNEGLGFRPVETMYQLERALDRSA